MSRPDHLQGDGRVIRSVSYTGCLYRVAVHSGVVERGDVVSRSGILGKHLSERVQQRGSLSLKDVEVAQNPLKRVFDAQHGLVVVSVSVFVGVHFLSSCPAQSLLVAVSVRQLGISSSPQPSP